ncbi:hypothetical protein BCU84_20165 [Shewanella sp. 10N.286.51.B7]|uniref:hypothetical protein n=1 Tax=Shewanella sp. 10N.286.51.B7 TaxID=1880836 RepID=UPI000C85A70C|nr:hypothetical protein [Shewanella sp. 10N.286.51.B7]PMG71845.1 hypothetical protein BCU84_20165 [Shewanella sp. 10N.286.51.B7]
MKSISTLSIALLCITSAAHGASISNDIAVMFPEMEINQQSEPLYKSVGFDVSMHDGEAIYTANASVDISETWRVFGEYNNEHYWEVGVGKSFYTQAFAIELSAKASDYGFSAGTFWAMPLQEDYVLFADANYNWNTNDLSIEADRVSSDYTPADSVDIQLGLLWKAHEYIGISYSFNQIYETKSASLNTDITLPEYDVSHKHHYLYGKGSMNYHKLSITSKIWKLAPYFSYSYFADSENIYEFGLAFNF